MLDEIRFATTYASVIGGRAAPTEIGDIDTEIVPSGSELAFSWHGEACATYGLEVADDLTSGSWETVTNIAGADEAISLTTEMNQTNVYRVSGKLISNFCQAVRRWGSAGTAKPGQPMASK